MSLRISSITVLAAGRQWISDGNFQFDFFYKPNTVGEVIQNVLNVLSTPIGSQILLRSFGMDQRFIDMPGNVGQFQARTAALLSIGLWEPRANIVAIDFILNTSGVLAGSYALYLQIEVNLTLEVTVNLFSAPAVTPLYLLDAPFALDGSTTPTVQSESLNIYTG
jgi:phage baseplate assembly protein W